MFRNRQHIVFNFKDFISVGLLLLIFYLISSPQNKYPEADGKDYSSNSASKGGEGELFWFNNYANSDHFNLFNLFNVFRGSESKLLDDHGNLIPLDSSELLAAESSTLPGEQQHQAQEHSSTSTNWPNFSQLPSSSRAVDIKQFLIHSSPTRPQQKQPFGASREGEPTKEAKQPASPIVLVPGYGGSRLEAKLNKPSVVRYFCDLQSDWSDIWINVKMLLPYMIDCLIDNLRLEYNPETRTTHNTAGVEIRVKNPKSISSVEYLHQLPLSGFAYFAPIVEKLVDSLNYQRELDITGAPYDFRKAPNELGQHFEYLKEQTERLFHENQNKRVTYICHSMGCNQMLYFFQRQEQSWKDKYVRRLISLAAPWAGSFSALRAAAMGDDLGLPYLFSESKLIKVQRSLPSTIFLFPHKDVFSNVPLIKANIGRNQFNSRQQQHQQQASLFPANYSGSPEELLNQSTGHQQQPAKQYTVNDFEAFFKDINHPDGYQMWLDTKDLLGGLEAPQVEIHCFVGRGQKTLGRMEFFGSFPNSPNLEFYDDGDGTVTLESAKYCLNWASQQKHPVVYKEFNVSHMGILKDVQILNQIHQILDSENGQGS